VVDLAMMDNRRVLLCAFLASLAAPIGLCTYAIADSPGEVDLLVVLNYGLAIWFFSLIATMTGALVILLLGKVFRGKVSAVALAAVLAVAIVIGAYLGLSRDGALSLSSVAAVTLLGFVLAWRFVR
jgi:hypothetical protein